MASNVPPDEMVSTIPIPPDFIRFLFSNKPKFDCYFEVGNKSHGKPEKIGAVKLMLMAHSEVFRLQLEESDLADKGEIPVEDVHPDTFKGMLKYVYGHDTTSDLCFDEADNMLYVAEKYMIKTLKNKLAVRLMELLDTDNICSLLNNPVCYTHLELDSAITKILRYETGCVLESPQFLEVNSDGFLKILEQDGLAVPEIELWRAAIKWAKHRANSDDGKLLRQQISSLTKHLRVCSMPINVFLCEVASTKVFNNDEISAVAQAIGMNEKPQDVPKICEEIISREFLHLPNKTEHKIIFNSNDVGVLVSEHNYSFTVLTTDCNIELLPLVCFSESMSLIPKRWTYNVECTTTITEINNPRKPYTTDPPITATWSGDVKFGEEFEVPLAVEGRNATLLSDTKYEVKIKLTGLHQRFQKTQMFSYTHDNMILTWTSNYSGYGDSYHSNFPSKGIRYIATIME